VADQHEPDGLDGDGQAEEVPQLPGGAVRPGTLGGDDRRFLGRGEPGPRAPTAVPERFGASLPEPLEVAAQGPGRDVEQPRGGPPV
jgi:hypothetical protein